MKAGFFLLLLHRLRIGAGIGQGLKAFGHRRILEIEHRVRLKLTQLRQRRQIVKVLQVEVVEKGLGGGKHRRLARHLAITDHPNPFTLQQGLDDLAVDRHPAHILDLAPGNRLAIGNECQGFQHRPGITLWTLLPEPTDPGRELFANLQAIAGSHFLEFKGTAIAGLGEERQGFLEDCRLWALGFLEQLVQAFQRLRLSRGQQKSFKQRSQLAGFSQIH